jgi:hypothetical protein
MAVSSKASTKKAYVQARPMLNSRWVRVALGSPNSGATLVPNMIRKVTGNEPRRTGPAARDLLAK